MVISKEEWKKFTYKETLPEDYSAFRKLLETYSKIPPEEVEDHLFKIRDKAWAVIQYPCIGRFSWTSLWYFQDPEMTAAIERLKAPDSTDAFLDLACCVGQTTRQLVALGVDSSRLYASDLHQEFLDIGFELFRDKDRIKTVFASGDMLDPDDASLKQMDGKISIINAVNFFHLFSWDQQVVIGKRIVRFLQPGRTDAVLFGSQIGSEDPSDTVGPNGSHRYLHDADSFQRLWEEVGAATGTRWNVRVIVVGPLPFAVPGFGDDARLVMYSVKQQPPHA